MLRYRKTAERTCLWTLSNTLAKICWSMNFWRRKRFWSGAAAAAVVVLGVLANVAKILDFLGAKGADLLTGVGRHWQVGAAVVGGVVVIALGLYTF
jgi:hypothetical protein